ncbi:hypothetical protein ACPC5Q_02400 [Acinetobacter junii]|uniref:hypothetical protein n=1 Tax=Acinetobacter junii TaxID=40215 RepID=UPI003C2371A3
MNDFFLLNNESLPHVFIDQNIEIKQIQVKNLNQFAYFADPIKKLESYSIETITALVETEIFNIMGLCSLVTSLDAEAFSKHIANQDAIAELVLKIIQVNEAFFKKEKQQSRSKTEVNEATWFDSFQYLISCGHRPDEILNMPYGAFLKYIEAAQRNERQKIKNTAIAVRIAMQSSKQEWEKSMKQLEK